MIPVEIVLINMTEQKNNTGKRQITNQMKSTLSVMCLNEDLRKQVCSYRCWMLYFVSTTTY